jgi:hypothetical protein
MRDSTFDTSFLMEAIAGHGEAPSAFLHVATCRACSFALDVDGVLYDQWYDIGVMRHDEYSKLILRADDEGRVNRQYFSKMKAVNDGLRKLPLAERPREVDKVVVSIAFQTASKIVASNDGHIKDCPWVHRELQLCTPVDCSAILAAH